MFNNPLSNMSQFFNRNNKTGAAGSQNDPLSKLKAKYGKGKTSSDAEAAAAESDSSEATKKKSRPNYADKFERSKSGDKEGKGSSAAAEDTVELSPMEQRKKRLEEIMQKVEEEYAAKYPSLAKKDKEAAEASKTTTESSSIVTSDDPSTLAALEDKEGISGFINDMPLFKEFKTGLMDAFKRLDSSSAGSISAQYELNYTSMQYIANEAGGYEYKETSLNIKLDLNYVKAASGGKTGADIAKAIENADDFESFVAALKDISNQQGAMGGMEEAAAASESASVSSSNDPMSQYMDANGKPMSAKQLMNSLFKNVGPDGVMKGMQDYFGPEATAGRIVDFATAFFPMSDEFKNGGDTEESRKAFSDRMGKAIQKGFDDAIGKIGGNFTGSVKDGVDKTHELVFKGLEDFVKNGVKPEKEETQKALEEFAFSFEMSYSQKTSSVSYGNASKESSNVDTKA